MRWVLVLAALAACGESFEGYTSQSMCEEIAVRTCKRSMNVCHNFTSDAPGVCEVDEYGWVPAAVIEPYECCAMRGGCDDALELAPAYVEDCLQAVDAKWTCEQINIFADTPPLPAECL